jgi:Transposase, Mutator family
LRIPKLRAGSFFPSLLERRRRVDQTLFAVVMEAYLHGVSTRKVDDLVCALGADSGISKSEASRIWDDLDSEVSAFRDRSLAGRLQDDLCGFEPGERVAARCGEVPEHLDGRVLAPGTSVVGEHRVPQRAR